MLKKQIKIKRNKRDDKIGVRKSNEEKNKETEAGKIAQLSIYTSRKKEKVNGSRRKKETTVDSVGGGKCEVKRRAR